MAAAGTTSIRLAAGGVLAILFATGVLFGRIWERRASLTDDGAVAVVDSTQIRASTGGRNGRSGSRGGGSSRGGPPRIEDRTLAPFERLENTMLRRVDGLTEDQATDLFLAWDSLRDSQQDVLESAWRGHWEGGYQAGYDPLRSQADSLSGLTRAIYQEARAAYRSREDSLQRFHRGEVLRLIDSFLTPEQVVQYDSMRAQFDSVQAARRSSGPGDGGQNGPGNGNRNSRRGGRGG